MLSWFCQVSLDFCRSRKGWLDVFRLIQGSFLHRKTRKVIKRIVKFNFSSGKIKCVFEGVKLIIFLIKDEKNEKVVRVPKNHCIFLSIKTFDRCQKEKTKRKSSAHIRDGARGKTHSSISPSACEVGGGGGVWYPLHLDHSIAFYAGAFMSNYYFSHFQVMRVFIEHNEQFEIQCVDQWLGGKQIL